jgi:hypothetical protein
MINALIETINPKGGKGVKESFIFLTLIVAIFALNVLQIPVSEEMKYILYLVGGSMAGYMVGTNKKDKKAKGDANE